MGSFIRATVTLSGGARLLTLFLALHTGVSHNAQEGFKHNHSTAMGKYPARGLQIVYSRGPATQGGAKQTKKVL